MFVRVFLLSFILFLICQFFETYNCSNLLFVNPILATASNVYSAPVVIFTSTLQFISFVEYQPFNFQDLISNSLYCLPYSSCDVSLENLGLDQLIIP